MATVKDLIVLGGSRLIGDTIGSKFITDGGTSNLFVKGDGTLDDSTYLTLTTLNSGNPDLAAIEALSGTSGLLKKTAANTWTLDTNAYLTQAAFNSGNPDLAAIEALSGTSGILKKTANNTWVLDTNTYLTSFTETDPTVPSHVKSITQQDITNWNNKLSSAPVTSVNGQTGAVVISDATTTTNGLMSSNDKIKLNELKNSVKVFNVTASSFEESNVAIDWGDIKFSTITNAIENYDVVKIIVNLPPADGFSQIISLYHNETVSVPELNAFGYCFTSIDAVFGLIATALVLAKDTENEESDNITAQLLKCNISNKQDAISDLNDIRNNAEEGSQAWDALSNYQELLVSGKNIKTINDESILQKGNISIYWDRDEKIRDKYENQYLTFEIVEPGTIEWQFNGGSNYARYKKQISYNINDQGWNTTDATNDLFTIGTFEVGDIIQFKGNASDYAQGSNLAYNHFSGTASFNIYGNILSLRYDTNELSSYNLTSIIVYGLFEHTNVINAKNLILPYITTTLCYNKLFSHCQKLISAPELPAPIISGISCYSSMFSNCTNLEIGPKILARSIRTGVDNCNYSLSSMFSGCTKLKLIYCLLESVDVNNTTTFYDFTKNVASTGTFCADINAEWPTGTNGIPVGWQVCTPREFLENVLTKVNNIENNAVTSVNGMTGAVTIENQLSNDYSPSTLINEDLVLESGDTYEEAFGKLEKLINDNEEITAAALTNLDERIPVIDQELSETSENPVQNKVITQAIIDNEYVVSTALNNINDRLENKQDTLVSGTNIKTINGTSILGSGNINIAGGSGTGGGGDTNIIETIKVNGTALTPDANKAVDITVPTTLDSISDGNTRKLSNYLPLSGGTMTGAITVAPGDGKGLLFSTTSNINVSGTTNTILGFYNGTYIIGHTAYPVNIRGTNTRPNYNGNQLALYSDIPSAVTESTVSGWGFTKNAGTVTGVKMNGTTNNPTSGVVDLGTVITEHQDISGKANKNGSFNEEFNVSALNIDADGEQINLRADYNSQEKEVTLDITESNGGCHLKYIFDESGDTKYIATTDDLPTKTSDLTNDSGFLTTHQSIKSLNTNNTSAQTASASETITGSGTINLHKVAKTGTYSDLIGKPTIPAAQVQSDWNATSGMGVILNKPTIPTVNNATLTIQKNGTTVNTFTANASSNVTANIQVNELPTVSSSDNGKILQVVNGAWSLVTPVTVYTGTSTPNSSLGINGDLYVLTS